jgi:8-amino-7-oxononanoate synthase
MQKRLGRCPVFPGFIRPYVMPLSLNHRCLAFLDALPPDQRRHFPSYSEEKVLDFTSNDTLNLSGHPALKAAAIQAMKDYGVGSTGSRLLSGNHPLHMAVEERLASLKKTESALVFGGGFHTNASVLVALVSLPLWPKPPLLIMDKWIHACWLRGAEGAPVVRYRHQDFDHLERLIQKHAPQHTPIIVTESIFSMDGDITDLSALARLKQRYPESLLIVDEAHATGAWGAGLVLPEHGADIVTGTFSKALGCYGGYVACSAAIREILIQKCPGLIYATAMPPMVLGAVGAALDLLPTLQDQRKHLYVLAEEARTLLQNQGWDTGLSQTHIIPIMVGDNAQCLNLRETLAKENIGASAIRPPTVPPGTARLRLSLRVDHTRADVERLLQSLS